MDTKVHFSSASVEWATPQAFFDELNAEFHFTLDVCANAENAKCKRFFSETDNGLAQSWAGETCWMNPPYGRSLGRWVAKASSSSSRVVCLLPARTDTRWWHNYIWNALEHSPYLGIEVRLLKGRLKFGNCKDSAPFPSAVVVFR